MNGVLIVDKPAGCTSHDVVQRVRKAIRQRSVGHAGTLDPLATGVLVVAIGEGTKLVSHLQSDDKRYEVSIALGAETDSLDADGEVIDTADVPKLDRTAVERALQPFIGRQPQTAPKLSAIKIAGTPLHRRMRRGEEVEAPVREVELYEANVVEVGQETIGLRLHCGKGFYVRSLARDLARALGTLGYVKDLRRTASGPFSIDSALYGDQMTAEEIEGRLIPLREACSTLRRVELSDDGVAHARHGRPIGPEVIVNEGWQEALPEESLALFAPDGEPVALGRRVDQGVRVVRGFAAGAPDVVSR
ncbi:MAG: tRNA pseudouridine(55) synthase TruB [Myxococcales bacterium]|nr:tRNA pseudouridine(55) synthase TruB [Myxococcales bacterium]